MDADIYPAVAGIEDRHWWFRGRRAILARVLDRYAPPPPRRILEVGCGNGGNLPLLAKYGELSAAEVDDGARERAAARGLARIAKGRLPHGLPFLDERFDLIAALDVLEHVDDDAAALRALQARLDPGGVLVATVPAYSWLWSRHDEATHHKRRYTLPSFVAKVRAAGFAPLHASYFNTLLFPLAVAHIKLVQPLAPGAGLALPPAPVNRALAALFAAERWMVPRLALPFGLSILACARAERG
jgi:SAM-dependent methyltransferase